MEHVSKQAMFEDARGTGFAAAGAAGPLMRLASYFDGAACQYVWEDDVGADHVADQRGAMRLASTRARETLGALRRDGDQATPA